MRICIFTDTFPARSETFIVRHALGLAGRGHTVTVIRRNVGSGITSDENISIEAAGVEVLESRTMSHCRRKNIAFMMTQVTRNPRRLACIFPKGGWLRHEMLEAGAAVDLARGRQFDVVHIHYGYLAATMHLMWPEQPMIVTWHGIDASVFPRSRGENIYRNLFSARHVQTVGSEWMRRRLLELGARVDDVEKLPMGIDLSRFQYIERPAPQGRYLRIVSVGRLDEMKGHVFLIEAVRRLIGEGKRVSLRIIGEGPLREELATQISAAGLEEWVSLIGAKPTAEIVAELHRADLFALAGIVASTGRVETQGVVFAEAQATGLPVIACDVGGVSESLIDGKTGFLCTPGDAGAIASAIRTFLDAPSKLYIFGSAGRLFVEQKFCYNRMLDTLEEIYKRMIRVDY
jgi:colanic acid/amylovoran biosynthesis glycosyltransferase